MIDFWMMHPSPICTDADVPSSNAIFDSFTEELGQTDCKSCMLLAVILNKEPFDVDELELLLFKKDFYPSRLAR